MCMKGVVRLELTGQMLDRFKAVKQYYGIARNTDVLRTLISEKYDRLEQVKTKKIRISEETYETLEIGAKELGITVDEFAVKLVEQQVKQARAKVRNKNQ
jgi:hypothetical protein